MTWYEFKDAVDAALKEAGKDDAEPIDFIDISYPDDIDRLMIGVNGEGIQITN